MRAHKFQRKIAIYRSMIFNNYLLRIRVKNQSPSKAIVSIRDGGLRELILQNLPNNLMRASLKLQELKAQK